MRAALATLALLLGLQGEHPAPPVCEGAVRTPSGLAYCELRAGTGRRVQPNDVVLVHYVLWLGEKGEQFFHSTRTEHRPFRARVDKVIPGFTEALPLMSVGSVFRLDVPAELGYGEKGGPGIAPNTPLVFELEVLSAEPLPEYRPASGAQETMPSGVRFEVVREGEGRELHYGENCLLWFAEWTSSGRLTTCYAESGEAWNYFEERALHPFLEEVVPGMHAGARYRFEVPLYRYRTGSNDERSFQVVELEILEFLKPLPVPPFEPLAADARKLPNGLAYEVVRAGEGDPPAAGTKVKVHFAGWLPDGTLLHSSHAGGTPRTFEVGDVDVIKGWSEAVKLMRPGAVYKVRVPARLAYGRLGSRKLGVGPNEELVYRIELVEVLAPE